MAPVIVGWLVTLTHEVLEVEPHEAHPHGENEHDGDGHHHVVARVRLVRHAVVVDSYRRTLAVLAGKLPHDMPENNRHAQAVGLNAHREDTDRVQLANVQPVVEHGVFHLEVNQRLGRVELGADGVPLIGSRWTNQTHEARVYSHDGAIRRRKCEYILTMDQSDAGSADIFSRRTNRTQKARAYSHDGPIRRRKRGYILTTEQSDAGSARIFSQWTNRTQEARIYSHDGPIGRRKRGYIRTMDQSDAGSAGIFS
eukprot:5568162-Pyramimonas_sp.AAC.1